MNEERLLTLANFLRNEVPNENFNMSFWRSGRDMSDWALQHHKCGTSGCAVGWACVIPEFKASGLRDTGGCPVYGEHGGWDAVEAFFEIDYYAAVALFSLDNYEDHPTQTEVADRIEQFTAQPEYVLMRARETYDENERMANGDDEEIDGNEEEPEDDDA